MSPTSKLSILAAILLADLLFFLFLGIYYPEVLSTVLQWLPWEDSLEKAVLILSGLIIAVLTSTAMIRVAVKALQRTVE